MFEVWWSFTKKIDMKKLLPIIFLLVFLTSCSDSNDDSFTLVCNVNTETTVNLGSQVTNEKGKETVTWIFKNRKIDVLNNFDIYQCSSWTKQDIGCDYKYDNGDRRHTESIRIDRMSGVINYSKLMFDEKSKTGSSKYYTGNCEKVKDKKF